MRKHFIEFQCRVLNKLLAFNQPLGIIKSELEKITWQSEDKVIILTKRHIFNVLEKYTKKQISSSELIEWINIIQTRDDIKIDKSNVDFLKEIIVKLGQVNETTK